MPYLTLALATGWRHDLWLALLIAASIAFMLGFACTLPFAAFGAVAAMTLPRPDALLLSVAVWLVNQVIGFTVLDYPWDASTLTWGAALGGVAVLSTVAALAAIRERRLIGAWLAGFATAFVAYEGGLYLVSALWLSGTENFARAIVLRILAINAAAFVVFLAGGLLFASSWPRLGMIDGTNRPFARQ
jgi:hypothetical protein